MAGIKLGIMPGAWPEDLSGLGGRTLGRFGACRDCQSAQGPDRPGLAIEGSWTTYGGVQLCLRHARERAA
jgi:hypothetical protein